MKGRDVGSYVHFTFKVFTRHGKVYAPYTVLSVIYQTSESLQRMHGFAQDYYNIIE